MTIITAKPADIDQLLAARVAQTQSALDAQYLSMVDNADDPQAWENALSLTRQASTAVFAQQQNFVLQHHLAKTILSTT